MAWGSGALQRRSLGPRWVLSQLPRLLAGFSSFKEVRGAGDWPGYQSREPEAHCPGFSLNLTEGIVHSLKGKRARTPRAPALLPCRVLGASWVGMKYRGGSCWSKPWSCQGAASANVISLCRTSLCPVPGVVKHPWRTESCLRHASAPGDSQNCNFSFIAGVPFPLVY